MICDRPGASGDDVVGTEGDVGDPGRQAHAERAIADHRAVERPPIRLRAIVESWVPLSTRIPPQPELTITLSVTVSCDSSAGQAAVPQSGLPSSRTPTWLLTVAADALFPVGSVPMKLPTTWLLIVPVPWEISTPELRLPGDDVSLLERRAADDVAVGAPVDVDAHAPPRRGAGFPSGRGR